MKAFAIVLLVLFIGYAVTYAGLESTVQQQIDINAQAIRAGATQTVAALSATVTRTPTQTPTVTPTFTALPTLLACGSTKGYAIFGASWGNSNDCAPAPTDGWQAAYMAARNPAYDMYYMGYLTISPTAMQCPYNNSTGGNTSDQILYTIQTQLPTMVKTPSANHVVVLFSSEANDIFHGGNQASMAAGIQLQISATAIADSLARIVLVKWPSDNPIFTAAQSAQIRGADDDAYAWALARSYNIYEVDSDGCFEASTYCQSGALGHLIAAGWRQMGGCLASRFQAQGI